ncbi:MAG: DUF1963 domain-containing protein [Paracoccaceae bacterium]
MPRNPPPLAQPAITITYDYQKSVDPCPILFGGAPQLPDALDWPLNREGRPMHFFAQVDLGLLPRSMEQADQTFLMPDFPKKGTLFFFLPLEGDMIFMDGAKVLFAPEGAGGCERPPPDEIPLIEDDSYIDTAEVIPDRTMLKRQYGAVHTYLSYRAENPLWRNMERPSNPQEVYERDLAYAAQMKSLGVEYHVPLPDPEAVFEPIYEEIPTWFQGSFQRGVFQWTWEYIFEFSKRAHAKCYDLPVQVIEDHNDQVSPRYRRYINKMKQKKTEILAETLDGKSGWWQKTAGDHVPSTDIRTDVQFKRWMHYARQNQNKLMSDDDKRAFVVMLQKIKCDADRDAPANLAALARVGHAYEGWDVYMICKDAFKEIAHERSDLHPGRNAEPQFNFGDTDTRQLQMFGLGYVLQRAPIEHEDKVLLLQLSNACGVNYGDVDMILQVWITHDDLAAGRFDNIISTLDMS